MSAVQIVSKADVGVAYLQVTTAENTEVKRAPGLILTQEDIISIKLYVKYGLSLPTKDMEVISYLGYREVGIAGLEPTDIKILFEAIKANAAKWDPLETDIKQQSISLDIFADRITATGQNIISAITGMPVIEQVRRKIGTIENLQDINPDIKIPFSQEDGEISYALKGLLEIIKKDVTEQKNSTTAIKDRIKDFRTGIATKIEPEVAAKKELIKTSTLASKNARLRSEISENSGRIEQLKKDYDKNLGLCFVGAPLGGLGLVITGGFFGEKAEKARKDRNQLIEENAKLVETLSTGESVEKAVLILRDKLFDVQTRLIEAENACVHLEFVWNTMLANIEASLTAFNNVNEGISLILFKTEFGRIVDPWNKVKDYSTKLIVLFDEALDVYKQTQGLQ